MMEHVYHPAGRDRQSSDGQQFGAETSARVTLWPRKDKDRSIVSVMTARTALAYVLAHNGVEPLGRWWIDIEGGPTVTTLMEARHLLDQLNGYGGH